MDTPLNKSFVEILLTDVAGAMRRYEDSSTQAHRRDLVRTSFAALEGVVWIFREHVIEAARTTYGLERNEEIALSELSYQVAENGQIYGQPRFVPLLSIVRLIARIGDRIAPNAPIDFSGSEWRRVKDAIKIRNRITHPKSGEDMVLTQTEVETSLAALFWLLEGTSNVMETANIAARDYFGRFGEVLQKLKSGDPEVIALYNLIALSDRDA